MVKRFATAIALAVAALVYVAFFFLLTGASVPVRLLVPAAVAAVAAIGVQFLLGRTAAEVRADDYTGMARDKVREVNAALAHTVRVARRVRDPRVRQGVELAGRQVPELLARIADEEPDSLYSSATKFEGHVHSLDGLVSRYIDIEARPNYFNDPATLLAEGLAAIERFNRFTVDSIRLVNQGDMSEYQANLQLVAPPEIPDLGPR